MKKTGSKKKSHALLWLVLIVLAVIAVYAALILSGKARPFWAADPEMTASLESESTAAPDTSSGSAENTEACSQADTDASSAASDPADSASESESEASTDPAEAQTSGSEEATRPAAVNNDGLDAPHPEAPELPYLKTLQIPAYSGEPYVILNEGMPFFSTSDLTAESYEIYYDLDDLGRCTLADAVVGQDMMPTEPRGSISSVKPTGWHSVKYPKDLVDGESLYNRCHLIAFGMCGETANAYNLVTGTRYFNTKGVNDFENMIIDYVRETGNHVRYRVTPVFTGENLICDGQIVEAYSVEDSGEAICFCIFAYNVQPGIVIDYLTGDSWLENAPPETTESTSASPDIRILKEDIVGDLVMNTKSRKLHKADCSGASGISEKNRKEYHGSANELLKEGYTPDPACFGPLEYMESEK